MPLPTPMNIPSVSNFQYTFNYALHTYKKRTREDLFTHPLARRLRSCDSPQATLSVLQEQASSDDRFSKWLSPAVNVIYAFSPSLGEDVGLVLSPAEVIFVAIGVLLSTSQVMDASKDALANVFARIERFFRQLETYAEISTTNSMKDMNEKIMLAVLSILTVVTEEIKQGPAKKYFKKLVRRNDVGDALQRLDELLLEEEARVATAGIPNTDNGAIRETTRYDSHAIPQMANDVECLNHPANASAVAYAGGGLSTIQWDQLQEEVQKWLSPPDPSTNRSAAHQALHEGTAQWFLQGKTFETWKSSGSLLWIHGKPGSGKSILCSAIIEDIETMCKSGLASMAYFFFDYRDNQKQSRPDMITSLLTQLSDRSNRYSDILSRLYSAHNRGPQTPTSDVLTQCLKEMLSVSCKSPVYIIMDAIDECPNIPGVPSPREEILELVKELVQARLPNLRLCVTSRPEISIRTVLQPLPSLRVSLHDEIGQKRDIIEYIKAVVGSDPKIGRWREEDKRLVINTLSERANGMFRWVSCQLDTLRHCFPPSVRRVLDELPESLDGTYERILMEISVTSGKQARRLLQCLTAALRPLRVEELAEILAVDFDAEGEVPKFNLNWRWEDQEQAVLSACSSLIAIVDIDGSKIVQFSHPSVKEFLMSRRLASSSERISFYHILLEPAHTILAHACLSVLLRLDDRINKDGIKRFPLAEYAARYWVDHARFEDVAPHIKNGMQLLFDPEKPHFANWIGIYDMDDFQGSPNTDATRPRGDSLYYSSLCGFHTLVDHLIVKRRMDVNARGGRYVTPLHASLNKGHITVALLLIWHGAEVNARDDEDSTPLRMALQCGHFEVVQALLENGADVNIHADKHCTPLHIASHGGYSDSVRLLLGSNAEVNARDGKGRTPLHIASHNGNSTIVRLLLEHDADVTVHDNEGSTPLHLVSVKGNLEVVELLVQHGADVDARDNKKSTPLHLALANGNRKVVEYLILHVADANAEDNKKWTPLHLASLNGDSDIVNLLVQNRAKVNAWDNKLWTPLHLASVKGTSEVVSILLQSGADVDARDNKSSTPLHVASRRGPSDVVMLLLKHGAEPNARNDNGWTPLHIASRERAVDVVRCLLGRGADVNAKDGDRRTPLHIAVKNKDSKIVELLIGNGADPCAQDNQKRIPYQM